MNMFKTNYMPLQISKADIEFLFEMVKGSSYVNGNPDYKKKAKATKIDFDVSNDIVNAYANSDEDGREHIICIFNGLCNATILMSIGIAKFKQDGNIQQLKEICRWIGETTVENGSSFTNAFIEEGIDKFGYSTGGNIGIEAKSYTAGAILSVIAHEQGHICLSHTIRGEGGNEVSRNDERQADLFAHSVTATTPFASHIILASLFVEILLSWMMEDDDVATSHPHSRERVYNALNSHDEVLRELGITKDNIDEFLR